MAASTADRYNLAGNGVAYLELPVAASTHLFKGICSCWNGGYLVPASDTAGLTYAGLTQMNVDNSAGSAGDLSCRIEPPEITETLTLDCSGADNTWHGKTVFFADDHTVALTTTNSVKAGIVVQVVSATRVVVRMAKNDA